MDPDARQARIRQILDGARLCFLAKGFHAASTAEISAAAGVSVANLYQYFATKDDLVLALIEDDLRSDLELIGLVARAPTLKDGLEQANRALYEQAGAADQLRLRLDVIAEATRRPAVAAAVLEAERKMIDAIAALLERAKEAGELGLPLEPRMAAALVLALTDGIACRFAFAPDEASAMVEASNSFILRALGAFAQP